MFQVSSSSYANGGFVHRVAQHSYVADVRCMNPMSSTEEDGA